MRADLSARKISIPESCVESGGEGGRLEAELLVPGLGVVSALVRDLFRA